MEFSVIWHKNMIMTNRERGNNNAKIKKENSVTVIDGNLDLLEFQYI